MVPNTPPPPSNEEKDPRRVDGEARKGDPVSLAALAVEYHPLCWTLVNGVPKFNWRGLEKGLGYMLKNGDIQLPSQNNGWISVSDRLPFTEKVLALSSHCGPVTAYWQPQMGRWTSAMFNGHFDYLFYEDITHWQPLPNPPKNP